MSRPKTRKMTLEDIDDPLRVTPAKVIPPEPARELHHYDMCFQCGRTIPAYRAEARSRTCYVCVARRFSEGYLQ